MIDYADTPLFGITLTIVIFVISNALYKKIRNPLFNPIVISIVSIIWILKYFNIDISSYEKGGDIIGFFLGPATVALAVPIYKRIDILRKNFSTIFIGIFMGSLVGMLAIIIMSKVLLIDDIMVLSLIPKSITSAIAIDLSKQIKGNPSITIAFVIATGTLGNIIGPRIFKIFRINNRTAKGIALGTASHIVGTARAIELGEIEGAMSSVAIGITGIVTVFLAPFIIKLLL